MRLIRLFLSVVFVFFISKTYAQDIDLYLAGHYLPGAAIIKLSRDFNDEYMWVLAGNNRVYRFNTLTKHLDDFTAQFQTYSGYRFFDVTGFNQNMFTIAARNDSGSLLITYDNGALSFPLTANPANAINGNVTSIGTSSEYTELAYLSAAPRVLMIATDIAFYRYVIDREGAIPNGDIPSQVYAATYRNQLVPLGVGTDSTGVNLIPTLSTIMGGGYLYNGLMRTGSPFGDTITTAYTTGNQLLTSPVGYTPDLFWGNKNGMFQMKFRNTSPFLSPYKQYLNNIPITKIVDIYGLTAFGNSVAKENLLVGTVNGLYYSSSFLHAGLDTTLDKFSLYHFDPLGNTPINFIEVNAASTQNPICENGIYVATDDGFYLVNPDFTPGLDTSKLVSAIHFNDPLQDTAGKNICAGDSIVAQVNADIKATSIQWFKDGAPINNASDPSLSIGAAGNYYAILYDPCTGLHLKSNQLAVKVISAPVFTFDYPDKIQECNTTPVALETTYSPSYHYRWYTNDVLNGDTTATFVATQTGQYKVEVSACTNSWIPSKEVEVDMITLPVPALSADKQQYCAEDTARLTVNVPVDPAYTLNWYQDGNLLAADQNLVTIKTTTGGSYSAQISSTIGPCTQTSAVLPVNFTPPPVFTLNYPDQLQYCAGTPVTLTVSGSNSYQYQWYLNDAPLSGSTATSLRLDQAGKYKVEVSSCPGSWVSSKEIEVNFISITAPQLTADKPVYCQGDQAMLSVNSQPSPSYTINWYQDGQLLTQAANQTQLSTAAAGNYTVTITANTPNTDGSICSASSGVQVISFNPPPTIDIQQTANSGFCQGQTVSLTATHSAGILQWSTGETTDEIQVSQTGDYTATVMTAAGCQASATQTVTFLPDPEFTVNDTTICTYKRQPVTLTAPAGYAAYSWDNGASTESTYPVDKPCTVSLTVTDNNGCQATRQIQVTEQCPEVYIPNAFTPNGDGINDTWDIEGLDASATVKVFTRWGGEVYQSVGYSDPWNGQYNGKKLQAGVYYYIVTDKNNTQQFSGSLTIIY